MIYSNKSCKRVLCLVILSLKGKKELGFGSEQRALATPLPRCAQKKKDKYGQIDVNTGHGAFSQSNNHAT